MGIMKETYLTKLLEQIITDLKVFRKIINRAI